MLTLAQFKDPTKDARPSPEKDDERRATKVGVLATLLIHALIFGLAPFLPTELLTGTHSNLDAIAAAKRAEDFNIELAGAEEAPPPDPTRFVETNPEAPENEPDQTANFSNRNQQSAQAEAPPEIDPQNRPSVQGQTEVENDSAIVSGEMSRPQDGNPAPPVQQETATPTAAQAARAEQVPLAGTEKFEGEAEDGIGANVAQTQSPTTHAPDYVEGAPDGKASTGGLTAVEETTPRTPRPRPRLTQARPTILKNRVAGTTNIGVVGIDARWSEYGDYMQEFIEIVQASWYGVLQTSRISPKPGTHVVVTFKLNSDGETQVVEVEETAGKTGAYACLTAISERQPYRKWTEQMIAVLGDEQTLTFSFYYQ